MRSIAIANQKGGVGKTTTSVNLAVALSRLEKQVCLIDLDPQAHATLHVGVSPGSSPYTAYDVLVNDQPLAAATVRAHENLWVVPSHLDLSVAEMSLAGRSGRESILRERIKNENKELDNYNKTGWGTKETTKRWVESTPGQVMPDVKPTPKSKTRTRKHPGSDVSDAGGMGEGAVKRGLLPSQDNFGPGMSKADHSNAKVSADTTYKPKPDELITKIKGARKSAKVLLKGPKK